ncbi:importin [Chloropicon primus]|nr:importin [Chloropicon primus]
MYAELKGALQASLSIHDEARNHGQQVLRTLENQVGYLSCLLQVALEAESGGGARELAGITLKHGISKLWRDTSAEEKVHLRSQLLDQVGGVVADGVAVHLSLGIGRIARYDFPEEWQELFPLLLQKLGAQGSSGGAGAGAQQLEDVSTKRNMYVLHCVMKELASKRLPAGRRAFQELSQQLLPVVWGLFCRASEEVANALRTGNAEGNKLLLCQVWHLCAKCMKRLLVSGFPSDAKTYQVHPQFKEVVPQTLEILKVIHQQYAATLLGTTSQAFAPQCGPQVLRGMLKILKLLRDMVEVHPWSFIIVETSVPALEYLFFNISSRPNSSAHGGQTGASPIFVEDICMLSMAVMQSIMRSSAYRSSVHREADPSKRQLVEGAQQLLSNFFCAERIQQMIYTVVSVHMALKEDDLEKWQVSPEEFHHENDLGNFNETLRSESEKLLCKFLETFKEQTVSILMKLVNEVESASGANVSSFESLLLKESLYNAMCLAAYDLHDCVNFKAFFDGQLVKDLSLQREENKIIVRRVAYLLAAWVADVPEDMRPQVYNLLMHQLLPCEDVVIKLAACAVLKVFIDDWNFHEDQFHPYMQQALHNLLLIIQHAYDFDSQVQSFNVLCLILERMGPRVKPFANDIVAMIPEVWQKAEDQSLLKIQILNAMHRMMQCLGASSVSTYNIVIPLLHYSVNPDGPESVSIFEDGLLLLRSVLQFAVEINPQLAEMSLFVSKHMQRSTEYLPVAAKVLEGFILVGGLPFLQVHHMNIFQTLFELTNAVNSRGMTMVTPIFDVILQVFPQSELALLEGVWGSLLHRLMQEQESDEALVHIVCVFARLAITNLAFFSQMLAKFAKERLGGNEDLLFGRLIYVWTEKAYASSSALKRKLLCVGLILALDTNHSSLQSRLDQILDFVLYIGQEFKMPNSLEHIDVAQEWHEGEDLEDYAIYSSGEEDPEAARRSRLWSADPVNKAQVVAMLQERVSKGTLKLGGELSERFKDLCSG